MLNLSYLKIKVFVERFCSVFLVFRRIIRLGGVRGEGWERNVVF